MSLILPLFICEMIYLIGFFFFLLSEIMKTKQKCLVSSRHSESVSYFYDNYSLIWILIY